LVSETSLVRHQGRTVDIVDLVQQLVSEQLAPLRSELNVQADKHASLQQTLFTQHLLDQEQLFLRVKAEYKKGLRDLQQLRKERAKCTNSLDAQQFDEYILQDTKDLETQLANLKHVYVDTIEGAREHKVTLLTLTGDESADF